MLMSGGSGGGGNGGRSGGGGGDAITLGGQVIKKGMTSSQLDAAIVGATKGERYDSRGGTPTGIAGQKAFVDAVKKAGIKASDYEAGTSWNSRLNRWLK